MNVNSATIEFMHHKPRASWFERIFLGWSYNKRKNMYEKKECKSGVLVGSSDFWIFSANGCDTPYYFHAYSYNELRMRLVYGCIPKLINPNHLSKRYVPTNTYVEI